jgi:hypothetical protein
VKLVVLPLALGELQDAAAFYSASANAELGLAFLTEFDRAVCAISANPFVGAVFRRTRLVTRNVIGYDVTRDSKF